MNDKPELDETNDKTAADYREEAAQSRAQAIESFERCDTDGFASQAASGITARVADARAELLDNDGRASFPALFDLEGNMVAAKLVSVENRFTGREQDSYLLLEDDDPDSGVAGWFSPSQASKTDTAIVNNAVKGYYVGLVDAPAWATTGAPRGARGMSGMLSVYVRIYRTDGGFSRDVKILDNGVKELARLNDKIKVKTLEAESKAQKKAQA